MASTNGHPRFRLQFGLRTLFCTILLVAVGLSVGQSYVAPFKRQRQVLSELQQLSVVARTRASDGPIWQKWLVGESDFIDVVSVRCVDPPSIGGGIACYAGPSLNDRVVDALTQLRSIEELTLMRSNVTDQQLQRLAMLPHIERLCLRETRIGDEGVKSLAQHKELKTLDLDTTLVSDAALEIVGQFEHLECLSLRSPNVKGPGLVHLGKLQALRHLQFHGPNVTNEWIAAVASLPNLESFVLNGTSVDERALEHIRRWKKLRVLLLYRNAFNREAIGDVKEHFPLLETFRASND
jgi:hypothetical protein